MTTEVEGDTGSARSANLANTIVNNPVYRERQTSKHRQRLCHGAFFTAFNIHLIEITSSREPFSSVYW